MNVDPGSHVLSNWQHETALASQRRANPPLWPSCFAFPHIPCDPPPLLPPPQRRRTVPVAGLQYSLQLLAGGGRPLALRIAPRGGRLLWAGPHWNNSIQHDAGAVPLGQPPLSPQRPLAITPRWPLTLSPHKVEDGQPLVRVGCPRPRPHRGAAGSRGRIAPPRRPPRRHRPSSDVGVPLRVYRESRGLAEMSRPLPSINRLSRLEPRQALMMPWRGARKRQPWALWEGGS